MDEDSNMMVRVVFVYDVLCLCCRKIGKKREREQFRYTVCIKLLKCFVASSVSKR